MTRTRIDRQTGSFTVASFYRDRDGRSVSGAELKKIAGELYNVMLVGVIDNRLTIVGDCQTVQRKF